MRIKKKKISKNDIIIQEHEDILKKKETILKAYSKKKCKSSKIALIIKDSWEEYSASIDEFLESIFLSVKNYTNIKIKSPKKGNILAKN